MYPADCPELSAAQNPYLEAAQRLDAIGFVRWGEGRAMAEVSVQARQLLGYRVDGDLTLGDCLARVQRRSVPRLRAAWGDAIEMRRPSFEHELPVVVDGLCRTVKLAAMLRFGADGGLADCLVAFRDATAGRQLAEALDESQKKLDEAQEIAHVGHWEIDLHRRSAQCSREAMRIYGVPAGWEPSIERLVEVVPVDQRAGLVVVFEQAIKARRSNFDYDFSFVDAAGATREIHGRVRVAYGPSGDPARLMGTIQDVSELTGYRRRLHSLANFDPLTDLPNRALMLERMREVLAKAAWQKHECGALMLDLDRFKDVNESMGHAAGDQLLKQAAARLSQALRHYDTVARMGGDEFAILLPEVRRADDLAGIASKVLQAFSAPFAIGGREVFVTASLGAALYPQDAQGAEELLQYADAALYSAKAKGRNNVQFYSPQLTAQASGRLTLETELRRGVERGELELFYQPKIDLVSRRIVGAEALMRWRHPQRGLVAPYTFIPMAEDTGLIVRMGAWALHDACRCAARWNAGGTNAPTPIAVNLSARQFTDGDIVGIVRSALAATGCQPQWLELEITESLLLDGRDDIRESLDALAALGLTIAIDDFGTGYSALSYLTRFPVQTLKIDRSFVIDLPGKRSSTELTRAIVSLGKSLQMKLVAEGVETNEQADYLQHIGCEQAQGYLFSKPVEAHAFEALLDPAARVRRAAAPVSGAAGE